MNLRIQKLKQCLKQRQLSSLLMFDSHNIQYLTGFDGHAATLLITPLHCYLLTDYRYYQQAKTQTADVIVLCRDRAKQSLGQLLNQLLNNEYISQLAFEAEHISLAAWQLLLDELTLSDVVPCTRIVEDLRCYKDPTEIGYIQQAAQIADQALANLLPSIIPGVSERDLAIELDYQMLTLGAQQVAFPTILLFGERSALPHGVPSERTLKSGDLVLLDFGAMVQGYRSDMTRTYVCGEPNARQLAVYNTVLAAQLAAIEAIQQGVSGAHLYQQSAAVLQRSEFARYMGEGLGHGVGLALHEQPFMAQNCQQQITKGVVITIEPGLYIPDWGGVRIEDDLVLTDQGLVQLTQAPKQLLVL
jgi:Xaa-Pro aminopeptidase